MAQRISTCLWRISDELIRALDEHFGDPDDAYVNGSQTWLRDNGPGDVTLEWRLHPVADYRRPASLASHYDVFPEVALAVVQGGTPLAPPESLWDGLEAFPAYETDVEPSPLAVAATNALGVAPDLAGIVDHGPIADAWEESNGGISIVEALEDQLR